MISKYKYEMEKKTNISKHLSPFNNYIDLRQMGFND